MQKIIFVTGGGISGLGKGVTASSVGRLMKSAGYSVGIVKMDPYLQVDAGTMSPYEHGEVFVTADGGETDLDIGNYERFTGEYFGKQNNITTGKVYLEVIQKERRGDFLGKTVQVIPHITDEIGRQIFLTANNYDITIVEVGGTVGDIESQPFLESLRRIRASFGKENIFFMHVAPLLHLSYSGENKTKIIQHSIIKLREYGIQPDSIVCRTETPINEQIRKKISDLCGVSPAGIIEAVNAKTVYQVPQKFFEQNLDTYIFEHFGLPKKRSDLSKWNSYVENIISPIGELHLTIIGKYAEFEDAYKSVTEAVIHAGAEKKKKIHIHWIASDELESEKYEEILDHQREQGKMDMMLVPGGFGERGVEGKIHAARFAREQNIPYLGLCLGLQVAVIEYARNVCGISDADSSEFSEISENFIIDFLEEQKNISEKGGTMRLGDFHAILQEDTRVHSLYGKKKITERHRHRYEVNPEYHDILEKNGLVISGKHETRNLVEFIELPSHPYFVATQAHPEFLSRPDSPHPLFVGLVEAALGEL